MKISTVFKLGLLLALAAGAGGVFWAARPPAVVAAVKRGRAVNVVPANVTVQAGYAMVLRGEAAGRVVTTALEVGRHVAPGDFLVQFDAGDLDLEIAQIQTDLDAARRRFAVGSTIQLELDNARQSLANDERLAQQGQFAAADLAKERRLTEEIEQRLALEAVDRQALLDGYENALKLKRRQVEKMRISSPVDGVVTDVQARPGDLIVAGAPLATLLASSRRVEAQVSEENFAGVRLGQKATVRFLTYGSRQFDATVAKILPTADAATQRYVVELTVDMAPELLVPGLTGAANVVVGEHPAALIIPRRALVGNAVLVVQDGRVSTRRVSPGFLSLNEVEILDGLHEGESVIVEEMNLFHEGDRVRTTPAEAGP